MNSFYLSVSVCCLKVLSICNTSYNVVFLYFNPTKQYRITVDNDLAQAARALCMSYNTLSWEGMNLIL